MAQLSSARGSAPSSGSRRNKSRSLYRGKLVPGKPEAATLEPPGEARRPNDAREELPWGNAFRRSRRREELPCVHQLAKLGRSSQSLVPRLAPAGRGRLEIIVRECGLAPCYDRFRQ